MSDCKNCSSGTDSSGFSSGFFMGLVVGGAGGYLLSTERGKELLNNIKDGAGDKLAELAENPQVTDKLAELENVMQEARKSLETGSDSARDKIHKAAKDVAAATSKKPKKNLFSRRGATLK